MYCKNCGKVVSEDATFCSGCGIRIDNERVKPTVDEQTVDQEYYSTLFVDKDETLIAKCSSEKFFDNSSYVKGVRAGQFGVLVTDKRIYLRGFITVSKEGKGKTLRRSKIFGMCGMRIDKTDIELKNIISTDLSGRKTLLNTIAFSLFSLMGLAVAYFCRKIGMEAAMWVFLGLSVFEIGSVLESCCFPLKYWLTLMTNEEIIMVLIKRKNRGAVRELQKKIHYAKSQSKSSEMQQDTQSW